MGAASSPEVAVLRSLWTGGTQQPSQQESGQSLLPRRVMAVYVDEIRRWPTKIRCFKAGSCHLISLRHRQEPKLQERIGGRMTDPSSTWRGHAIELVGDTWVYADTRQPVAADPARPCGHCGLPDTPEGHDGCLGTLPGVINACCGHGRIDEAYVQYADGSIVRAAGE